MSNVALKLGLCALLILAVMWGNCWAITLHPDWPEWVINGAIGTLIFVDTGILCFVIYVFVTLTI